MLSTALYACSFYTDCMMGISTFDELLQAARRQPEAQRLLLVFAGASLSDAAGPAERAAFKAGEGGEIAPLMCVDKPVAELASFAALAAEAESMGPSWVLVFAAAMSAAAGAPQVDAALERLVEAVRVGQLQGLIPFNRAGQAVNLG